MSRLGVGEYSEARQEDLLRALVTPSNETLSTQSRVLDFIVAKQVGCYSRLSSDGSNNFVGVIDEPAKWR